MREILLLISIVLGVVSPNAHLLTRVNEGLKSTPKATVGRQNTSDAKPIVTSPTRTALDDYSTTAKGEYSIDLASNAVLTSKDTDARLQVASLTKLMTAYVILKEEHDLGRVVTATNIAPQPGDAVMGIANGDQLTIRDLLDGLLINSGTDAAQALATAHAGTVESFVAKMNAAATALGFTNTHYTNPVGWDDPENYSSAKDITELARILLRNNTFSEIVSTKSKVITTVNGKTISLETTNQLLYTPGYVGVKTGYTPAAGECLVSLYRDGDHEVLTTLIGSGARFAETEHIKGWILTHFSW